MAYALREPEALKPLSMSQISILTEFYSSDFQTVILDKTQRQKIWHSFKKNRNISKLHITNRCPALNAELRKYVASGKLAQSAIFSECVYAQTLANILNLTEFSDCSDGSLDLNEQVLHLLSANSLTPRYAYWSKSQDRILVQAGGPGGIDSALVDIKQNSIITIEFKEALAKTSEADLPKYTESGLLAKTEKFLKKHPQFEPMIDEQISKNLNFFEAQGSNVKDFSLENVAKAINENYMAQKFADVICVEDNQGFLAMIPAHDLTRWSTIEGEIRPAGRNKYAVFTPQALESFISAEGGKISEGQVTFPFAKMKSAAKRGGDGQINRWKINSLFFVYAKDTEIVGSNAVFSLHDVKQLKPTISAHMDFQQLNADAIFDFYKNFIK